MINPYNNKRVLITGGLGMIGSTIANKLVNLNADVTILDAFLEPYGFNLFNIHPVKEKIKLIKGDIRNKEDLTRVIKNTDIIFNLAGQVSHNDSMEEPLFDSQINYIGHLNVLETVRRINPQIKIIYSGSRLQYGKILTNPVSEDHPLKPLSPYALNKSSAEQAYLFYNRMFGIPVVLFRISNPYGPRGQIKHNKYCIVNWFLRLAMEGKSITVFGDGAQLRDYIYVDDLANAMVQAAVHPDTSGRIFNVGCGKGETFLQMAQTVAATVGKGEVRCIPWPEKYINVETGDYVADITALSNAIDWVPNVSLNQGIKKTNEFYKKYKTHYC